MAATACAPTQDRLSFVSGALQCLQELAEGLSEDQLEPFASIVLPRFPALFTNYTHYDENDVLRGGKLIASLFNHIRMGILVALEELVDKVLKSKVVKIYVSVFLTLLELPLEHHLTVIKAAVIPLSALTETCGNRVSKAAGVRLVHSLAVLLHSASLRHESEVGKGVETDDGMSSTVEEFLYEATDLLQAVVLSGEFSAALGGEYVGLFGSLLRQSQVGPRTVERWSEEVESFVEEEESEGLGSSLRSATKDLLADVLEESEDPNILPAFCLAAQNQLQTSSKALGAAATHWWIPLEGALACLSLAAPYIRHMEDEGAKGGLGAVLSTLPGSIPNISAPQPPFPLLRGQLLCMLARFAPDLTPEMQQTVVSECVACLGREQPALVRLSAVKALTAICELVQGDELDKSVLKEEAGTMLRELGTFVGEGVTEQTYYVLLPAIQQLLKCCPEECGGCEVRIGPLCMALTLKFSGDPLIPAQAGDVLKLLARNPESRSAVLGRALPTALSVLRADSDVVPVHMPAVCLNLLTSLVQGVGSPLPHQFIQEVFPTVCGVSGSVGEQDVLAAGRECLRAFLTVAPRQTLAWRHEDGTTATATLVQIILHLLGPNAPELSGSCVNRLLYVLFHCALADLRPFMDSILSAALTRMAQTELASVRQSLLTIFAYAINYDPAATLHFLAQKKAPEGEGSALHFVLNDFVTRLSAAISNHDKKVCCLALTRLLQETAASPSSPSSALLAEGSPPLITNIALCLIQEWRLHRPHARGDLPSQIRTAAVDSRSSLEEALQSLAHDLGEAWSSDEDDDDGPQEGGESHIGDPLKEVDTNDLLNESVSGLLRGAEFRDALLPLLPVADRKALQAAGLL